MFPKGEGGLGVCLVCEWGFPHPFTMQIWANLQLGHWDPNAELNCLQIGAAVGLTNDE